MSGNIGDIIKVLDKLTDTEDKFFLWHEQNSYVPEGKYVMTLTSKYGFRRFLVTKEMNLEIVKKICIKADEDMCTPVADYLKKFIGYEYIDLSEIYFL